MPSGWRRPQRRCAVRHPDRVTHTHRLDLDDPSLRDWGATVVGVDERGIVLDRSAFYPGGGGQPPDTGVLLWGGVRTRIVGTGKGDDLYLVPAEADPAEVAGTVGSGPPLPPGRFGSIRDAIRDECRFA